MHRFRNLMLLSALMMAAGHASAFERYTSSVALIIGNSDYVNGWSDLPGVAEDVQAVQQFLLEELAFDVVEVVENASRDAFCEALFGFLDEHGGDPSGRLLIYFAGHGQTVPADETVRQLEAGCPQLALASENPASTAIDDEPAGFLVLPESPFVERASQVGGFVQSAIPFRYFRQLRERITARHVMFAFDSCFSGALFQNRSGLRILYAGNRNPPQIESLWSSPSTLYLTAGKEDQEVPDQSIFRRFFIDGLRGQADLDGDGFVLGSEIAMYVRSEVTRASDRAQEPQFQNARVSRADLGEILFVSQLPADNVDRGPAEEAVVAGPRRGQGFDYLAVFRDECPLCPEMIALQGGTALATGSTTPIGSFALSKYEITNAQWIACYQHAWCSRPLADFRPEAARRPVLGVSREDALEYVAWLNAATGDTDGYRLPSDAEWSYAARAGSSADEVLQSVVNEDSVNCSGCGDRESGPHEVGSLQPNRFGLHDMLGNAWEWVGDCARQEESTRCRQGWIRGGSFATPEREITLDVRHAYPVDAGFSNIGFRVASDL